MSKEQRKVFWPTLVVVMAILSALVLEATRDYAAASNQVTPTFHQHIRVWVHGDDVRPRVIHAWPGQVLLTSENEAGADVALVVEQLLPGLVNVLTRVPTAARKKRATQELTLVPGEYVFYEERQPAVRGKIIVEPRVLR